MKRLYTLFIALMVTGTVFAQSPNLINYQAVIRDAAQQVVSNGSVGMQLSILQGSATGTAVYVETHALTSNSNGVVNLQMGGGTLVSGDFGSIDWSTGPYFIQTEVDPTGGTNYTVIGTNQLVSVPYALHAKTADKALHDSVNVYTAGRGIEIENNEVSNKRQLFNANDVFVEQNLNPGGNMDMRWAVTSGSPRGVQDPAYSVDDQQIRVVTINETGLYKVGYEVTMETVTVGTEPTIVNVRLVKKSPPFSNFASINGTLGYMTLVPSTESTGNASRSAIHYFEAGESIKVWVRYSRGDGVVRTVSNASNFSIERIY